MEQRSVSTVNAWLKSPRRARQQHSTKCSRKTDMRRVACAIQNRLLSAGVLPVCNWPLERPDQQVWHEEKRCTTHGRNQIIYAAVNSSYVAIIFSPHDNVKQNLSRIAYPWLNSPELGLHSRLKTVAWPIATAHSSKRSIITQKYKDPGWNWW